MPLAAHHRSILILALALSITALIALLRYQTGPEYSLSLFFLFPVALATWHVASWAGALVSVAAAALWLTADLALRHPFSHPLVPYLNETFRLVVFLLTVWMLSRQKKLLESQRALARTDPLTGIPNRRAFLEAAATELSKVQRFGGPITLIYLDIDHFKYINDRHGHDAGDRLLQAVARILTENVRIMDSPARFGGDEFALLLPQTDVVAARSVTAKLQERLTLLSEWTGGPVTFSIGAATFASPPDTVAAMIKAADALMYAAKEQGRNRSQHAVLNGQTGIL